VEDYQTFGEMQARGPLKAQVEERPRNMRIACRFRYYRKRHQKEKEDSRYGYD